MQASYLQIVTHAGAIRIDSTAVTSAYNGSAPVPHPHRRRRKSIRSESWASHPQQHPIARGFRRHLEIFPCRLFPFARAAVRQGIEIQVKSGGICLVAES